MTINIGLVTSEALVLGCDSIASNSAYYLDPFNFLNVDENGDPIKDNNGKVSAVFDFNDLTRVAINVMGGVTKIFSINGKPAPVAAVTSGVAKLNHRTIKGLTEEFYIKHRDVGLTKTDDICNEFYSFFRNQYEEEHKESTVPEDFWDELSFLVGGYGEDDAFPSLYRIDIKNKDVIRQYADGNCGLSWDGQADGVERFIFGYDRFVKQALDQRMNHYRHDLSERTLTIIQGILSKLNHDMPDGIDTSLPSFDDYNIGQFDFSMLIDFANLPLQASIDLVSHLVLLQSARARFSMGIPTVGGRTRIGIVQKNIGFQLLDEPELAHKITGISDEL